MKGHITIGRRENAIQNGDENSELEYHLEIGIGDSASGRKFLSIKIDPAELVCALTGGHQRPLEFEIDEKMLALVGRKREHKTFRIRDKGRDKMVVPQRITDEGWQYSTGYGNTHTGFTENNKRYYNCSFIRYVDPVAVEDSSFEDEPDLPWDDQPQKIARAPSSKRRLVSAEKFSGKETYERLNANCEVPEKVAGYWREKATFQQNGKASLPFPVKMTLKEFDVDAFLSKLSKVESRAQKRHMKGWSTHRWDGTQNGSAEYKHKGWSWPSGYRTYIEQGVLPSASFFKFIMGSDLKGLPLF